MELISGLRTPLLAAIAFAATIGRAPAQQPMARASVDSAGAEADFGGGHPALSADGRTVAFSSGASTLVPGDTNGAVDVFVHDRMSGATVRVSVDSAGQEANSGSIGATLSADGRFVAFTSIASDLVPNDTNGVADAFVHDRDPDGNGLFDEGNGVTTRVSVDSNGNQANSWTFDVSISGDGSRVAFSSTASNLVAGDSNGTSDVFCRDLVRGKTVRASVDSTGGQVSRPSFSPALSGDGNFVAFYSDAPDLVVGDTNQLEDVFRHDLTTGATIRVSGDAAGGDADGASFSGAGALSADGSLVVFESLADDLVANDFNGFRDVFVRDVGGGTTIRVSLGPGGTEGNGDSFESAISGDGHVVGFSTVADSFGARDLGYRADCYVRDLALGTTELVSRDFTASSGDGESRRAAIDATGVAVVFDSVATDLVADDGNSWVDVFVFDRSIVPLQGAWTNYGAGHAGTLGVPGLTLTADPEFGATFSLQVDNSAGQWTVAFLAVGTTQASLPLAGGMLLVLPLQVLPFGLPPSGFPISCTVPYDNALFGFVLDVQAIEMDPGASQGLSFTPGLELVFGQ
ncbi:MAG TPA: calcium-binding protein [Planctomycetota bacterium]|nr:calcium-binding protein [Planctomycetota bacterium]